MKRILLFLFAFVLSLQVYSQDDLAWWDALHDYPNAAGYNRVRYQNISPGFLGPNALRVLPLLNGRINNEFWVGAAADIHRAPGDKTYNFFLDTNLALAKDRVMLYINSVPYEHYEVTPEVRDLRRMVNYSGEGTATGDIQAGTVFRLFIEENSGFNWTMRLHMKTTTGSDLKNARFTNHGMYVFDGQFSKTFIKTENNSLLIKAMLGFMTWQTNKNRLPNGSKYLQNDAPIYGIGVEYSWHRWFIGTDFSGYHGYVGNRDYPFFWRSQLAYRIKDFELRSEYNLGLKTWDWNTFRIGTRWYFAEAQ